MIADESISVNFVQYLESSEFLETLLKIMVISFNQSYNLEILE